VSEPRTLLSATLQAARVSLKVRSHLRDAAYADRSVPATLFQNNLDYEPAANPPRWATVRRRYLWGLTGVSLMRTS
jgi:hypothetical protein